jgi:hypothetical protein
MQASGELLCNQELGGLGGHWQAMMTIICKLAASAADQRVAILQMQPSLSLLQPKKSFMSWCDKNTKSDLVAERWPNYSFNWNNIV